MSHRIIYSLESTSNDRVHSGDSVLQAISVVQAEVRLRLGSKLKILTLNDALFIPGYMSNLVSLKRLNTVVIHHDTSNPLSLFRYVNSELFAWADLSMSKNEHWVLEKISLPENSAYGAKSLSSRKALAASPSKWHRILGNPSIRAIESLPANTEGCEFSSDEKISTVDCKLCLLYKAKAIVSRRSEINREISKINEEKHMVVGSWDIVEFTQGLNGAK